jgi:hypothetical protein
MIIITEEDSRWSHLDEVVVEIESATGGIAFGQLCTQERVSSCLRELGRACMRERRRRKG